MIVHVLHKNKVSYTEKASTSMQYFILSPNHYTNYKPSFGSWLTDCQLTVHSQVEADGGLAGAVMRRDGKHCRVIIGQLLDGDVGQAFRLLNVDNHSREVLFRGGGVCNRVGFITFLLKQS